ncbi:pyrroloquinoline quinone biosynthesis protein PqqE [Clostridiales bacterium CHKCI001]|nr:pyrroloquinoline quinone biosynthesis protein PqqE [Clostridiales bacterium CHKCI001]
MNFYGLQKLTLLDYPEKVACTLFTGGCNLRCPFCQNSELVIPNLYPEPLDFNQLLDFLKKRSQILDGICISGGEPLLHEDLSLYLKQFRNLGYTIKLDTNGCFPEHLKKLVNDGLIDYVAMDIKNSKKHYYKTAGVSSINLKAIEESVQFLLQNSIPYEFRTTVVKEFHTESDFISIGEWLRGAHTYYLQNFISSSYVLESNLHGFSKEELERFQTILLPYISNTKIR